MIYINIHILCKGKSGLSKFAIITIRLIKRSKLIYHSLHLWESMDQFTLFWIIFCFTYFFPPGSHLTYPGGLIWKPFATAGNWAANVPDGATCWAHLTLALSVFPHRVPILRPGSTGLHRTQYWYWLNMRNSRAAPTRVWTRGSRSARRRANHYTTTHGFLPFLAK